MKIPIIQANYPIPSSLPITARTEGAGQVWKAVGGAAEEAQNLIDTIVKQEGEVRSKLKDANDLLTTNEKKSEFVLFGQDLDKQLDSDPDQMNRLPKFMEGAKKKKQEILSTISDELLNKKIQLEIDRTLLAMSINQKDKGFKRTAEKIVGTSEQQILEMSNRGDIEGVKKITQKLVDLGIKDESWKVTKDNLAEETGEKSNISLRINSQDIAIIKSLIEDLDKGKYKTISPLERANYRVTAEKNIETIKKTKKIEDDETNITNAIRIVKDQWPGSPDMQNIILTNSKWQEEHGLDSKTAHTAQTRLKAEHDLMHDNDERKIGELFMKEDYANALKLIEQSGYLKGDEKKTWTTAIETQRDKIEKIDPNIEAAEIVMINNLISKDVDPRVIRNSVIITPRLSGGNKEQYLNKLEAKLTTEVADGRRQGYQDIKDIIFPPVRGLSIESLIQTPQQTTAIMKAQMVLDEWIDRQIRLEKYPTRNEIRAKASELANAYNPSISSRIEFMEEKAKKQAEEIKKVKEKKK